MREKFRELSGSIGFRFGAALLGITAMTATAVIIAFLVFQSLASSLGKFQTTLLPNIASSTSIINLAGETTGALSQVLLSETEDEMHKAADALDALQDSLLEASAGLEGAGAEQIRGHIEALDHDIVDMEMRLTQQFVAQEEMGAIIEALGALSNEASGRLLELSDRAFFDVMVEGEEASKSVAQSLEKLADSDMRAVQAVLKMRAEVNLLAGMTLARLETREPPLARILRGMAQASIVSLDRSLAAASEIPQVEAHMAPMREFRRVFADIASQKTLLFHSANADTVMALREASDIALAMALDDVAYDLILHTEHAGQSNMAAIDRLMHEELGRVRAAAALDYTVGEVIAKALVGVSAQDVATAEGAQLVVDQSLGKLRQEAGQLPSELAALVARIEEMTRPQSGAIGKRIAMLKAQAVAEEASRYAADELRAISRIADELSELAGAQMAGASADLTAQSQQAKGMMLIVAFISLTICIGAIYMTWTSIVRPLGRVSLATERLASGDVSEITGFENARGEVGRLAHALAVFRANILEREQMERKEKQRDMEEREAQRIADEEKRAREEAEHQRELDRLERQRLEDEERANEARLQAEQEAVLRAEIAEQRKEADARSAAERVEREERLREQQVVVSELESALGRLAKGDLDCRIEADFTEGYESLRQNFNSAIQTLSELVSQISGSIEVVSASSSQVTQSSKALSGQTDEVAAALEETAAALTELTETARQSAGRTNEANGMMQEASGKATRTSGIVASTVGTMSGIEQSSSKITRIVEMIESISFQTNLLALNASVEAARAGESGKGFAVVASEVRVLAQRASDAASEIDEIITETQEQVTNGVEQVADAEIALREIIEMVGAMSSHFEAITTTSQEQSLTIGSISENMSRLEEATNKNAEISRSAASTSNELDAQAHKLRSLAAFFSGVQAQDDGDEWAMLTG